MDIYTEYSAAQRQLAGDPRISRLGPAPLEPLCLRTFICTAGLKNNYRQGWAGKRFGGGKVTRLEIRIVLMYNS